MKPEIRDRRSETRDQIAEDSSQPVSGRRDKLKLFIILIAAISLIIMAGQQNQYLSKTRIPHPNASFSVQNPAFSPILLAGFRCLAADILWLRATDLQDQGRYFELVQLAEWITTLEPHFTEVWAVHAWNMTYNISIMIKNDQERWGWIQNGIHLLRDRGIPLNQNDPYLYTELGFIYLNKIGNPNDPSTQYYKREWAKEMIGLLGESGFPDYPTLESNPQIMQKMSSYKLIPERMKEIDRIYGPLDWRAPQTHALYWAHLGNSASGSNIHDPVCERMIYQSMTALFDYGKLTYSKEGDFFVTSTNFELLQNVISTFELAMKHAQNDLPQTAYVNFMTSAIRTHKFYRQDQKARDLFGKLHAQFPSKITEQGFESFTQHANASTMPQILTPTRGGVR